MLGYFIASWILINILWFATLNQVNAWVKEYLSIRRHKQ